MPNDLNCWADVRRIKSLAQHSLSPSPASATKFGADIWLESSLRAASYPRGHSHRGDVCSGVTSVGHSGNSSKCGASVGVGYLEEKDVCPTCGEMGGGGCFQICQACVTLEE